MVIDAINVEHNNFGFPDSDNERCRVLKSDNAKIGLFQQMFSDKILTFNPKNTWSIQIHLKLKKYIYAFKTSIF